MNTSNNMPDNNMNRMFISYFRENLIAHLLNMKYVTGHNLLVDGGKILN